MICTSRTQWLKNINFILIGFWLQGNPFTVSNKELLIHAWYIMSWKFSICLYDWPSERYLSNQIKKTILQMKATDSMFHRIYLKSRRPWPIVGSTKFSITIRIIEARFNQPRNHVTEYITVPNIDTDSH